MVVSTLRAFTSVPRTVESMDRLPSRLAALIEFADNVAATWPCRRGADVWVPVVSQSASDPVPRLRFLARRGQSIDAVVGAAGHLGEVVVVDPSRLSVERKPFDLLGAEVAEMKRPGKTRLVVDLEVEAQLTAKKGSRRTTAMVTGLYESGMVEVLANGRRFSLSEEWIRVPSGAHARLRKHARLAEASS